MQLCHRLWAFDSKHKTFVRRKKDSSDHWQHPDPQRDERLMPPSQTANDKPSQIDKLLSYPSNKAQRNTHKNIGLKRFKNSHANVRLASRLTMVPKELEARH